MVSTFTPNVQLEEPARGDQVGTWDTPVNNNMTELDLIAGGIATISAAAGSVTLSAAQLRSRMITFNNALAANISMTFASTFVKDYLVQHIATNSSAFTITLVTTVAGGQAIAIPPGETTHVYCDGTNIKFLNLERIGAYWDFAGSSVPNWVSGCTVPPYLNCDGTVFSSATYPVLAGQIGTTLPDCRGRKSHYANQGTGRLTAAGAGIDGNTLFAAGGNNGVTLASGQIPSLTSAGSFVSTQTGVPLNAVPFVALPTNSNAWGVMGQNNGATPIVCGQVTGPLSVTYTNGSPSIVPDASQGVVTGLRLIRAA